MSLLRVGIRMIFIAKMNFSDPFCCEKKTTAVGMFAHVYFYHVIHDWSSAIIRLACEVCVCVLKELVNVLRMFVWS